MQKNEKFFKKSIVLLIKHFIFAPANSNMLALLNNDLVAQLVEHFTFNERVLGSSPSPVTKSDTIRNQKLANLLISKFLSFLDNHLI